jgi:glycosyltransferase involved in cell wall biosynthesis
MYWVKDRFDVGVALDIRRTEQDAFIGMWGSSLRSFRAAGNNCIKVLNYVNSRPRYHNLYLRQYACLEDNHPEMIPEPTAGRVEEEMALADLLLVPSTFIALQMPEYREKVVIAPYGVDITHFAPRPGHGNQTFNVLYLGQISHRKGLKTLLSAARLLPSLTFRLAGPLVSRELIASLPPNACYIGPVHPAETPELMRCADVFVLPSFEDAYPLVTMEAMASGVPPIVSSNCGTAELLADGKAGSVFRVADADDLARHIQRLFDYPEVRRKAGQEARDRVVSAHTWEQYAERVLSMIDSTSKQLTTLPMPGSSTPDPTIRVGSNRDAGESSDPAMRN